MSDTPVDGIEEYYRTWGAWATDDVRQEAAYRTLCRPRRHAASYYMRLVRTLDRAHYQDTGLSLSHAHTWWREAVSVVDEEPSMAWATSSPIDPERQAILREELSRVPDWLIRLCVDEGFVLRRSCRTHPRQWWYPYRSSKGVAVRCRGCMAERTATANLRVVNP